ncbi:MAG: oxidoreductase [Gemmatimonadetes bacterium]|nr:MAG: oxidoreductase [Gemmatimonadota bacterium]
MANEDRWAIILGASTGVGGEIARAVACDPGFHVFGVHRGHYADDARRVEEDVRAAGRRIALHVADAGTADGARACATVFREHAGERRMGLFVHSISGASLGRFLPTRGDAFTPRQVDKTFDYLAHSFAYWAQALYELDLLAPGARLLGLTNVLHDSLLNNTGLVAAAKAALQMYVRHLAIELGPLGHRVNLLKFGTIITPAVRTVMGPEALARLNAIHRELIPAGRMGTAEDVARFVSVLARGETHWLNGATIDFTGGMMLRLLDVVLQPDSSHLQQAKGLPR